MGGFTNNPELARAAGRKSKRGKSVASEDIRSKIKDGMDVDKLMKELNKLKGKDLIMGASQLMNFFLPKMSQLKVEDSVAESLAKFQQMTPQQQAETLKEVEKIKNKV